MMIPITRKEKYINEIVGGGDTAPGTPQTREELFFADILGEVSAPSPITRIEKYLAKIAGKYNGELPEPVTRIELFIARAAGMNVSIPTPITREEMFWADYALIIEKEISGIPPLTFNAIAGALKDYRIYGQTSRNLFDVTAEHTVAYGTCYEYVISGLDPNLNYTCSTNYNQENHTDASVYFCGSLTPQNGVWQNEPKTYKPNNDGEVIILIRFSQYYEALPIYDAVVSGNIWIMVNEGDSPLPYEPYGESVGDRTGNLFDMKKFAELCYPRYASVTFADNTLSFTSTAVDAYVNHVCGEGDTVSDIYRPSCIDVLPSTTYTISMSSVPKCYISWINSSYKAVRTYTRIPVNQSSYTFTTPEDCTKLLIRLGKEVTNIGDTFTISNIMLNSGSAPLPYEPYGYKVPLTISNGIDTQTIPIYLPEQIRKVGDEAEYIDYGEQKQHRVRKNYLQTSDFEGGAIYTGQDWKNITYQVSKTPPGTKDLGGLVFDTTRKRSTDLITIIGTYTISIADGWEFGIVMFPNDINSGELFIYNTAPVTISDCTFAIQIKKSDLSDISSADISDYKIMLNKGSTPLPYEPYIENTDIDVTLPELPTLAGTNVLTVGTVVQPSDVYIKYEGER